VQREVDRQVGDDADDGGGDPRQGGGQVGVASEPLDVRRPDEDEQEAGDERHPRRQQGAEHRSGPRVDRAGVAVGAEERDELHDHDQWPGCHLGKPEAAHHLTRGEPVIDVDGLHGDEGENRVRAAERHECRAGEEHALVDEHAVTPVQQRDGTDRPEPQHKPRPAR